MVQTNNKLYFIYQFIQILIKTVNKYYVNKFCMLLVIVTDILFFLGDL